MIKTTENSSVSNPARQLLALFISCALFCCQLQARDLPQGTPSRQGIDQVRLQQLDKIMQSYVDNHQIAGSVTLVLRDGRVIYSSARGMQDIEAGVPMHRDSIFRIASQTKAIVSTAIMMLQERGALTISDPLSKYLPEWADSRVAEPKPDGGYDVVAARRPITLRDLLTHTSGIGYGLQGAANDEWVKAGISGWYLAGHEEPIRETVRAMAALPQRAHPGEEWIYGYNIDILGAVVEVASGRTLAEFLQDEIFTPLEMNDSYFYLPGDKATRLARVYMPDENGGLKPVPEGGSMQSQGQYVNGPRKNFSGGAGLLSTATDYARFLQMTLNGGELNGKRLLSPKTIELMTSNQLVDISFRPGEGMGLGFSVLEDLGKRGRPGSTGEYGWGGAYHSTYWVDPQERLVVVYLTQILAVGPSLDDFNKLRSLIYAAIVQ